MTTILRMLEILERNGNRLEKMLFQLKWPPPGLLPATLLDQLSLGFENGQLTGQDVDEILVQFYNQDRLQEMLNIWSERGHFSHRMKILKEAVAAHIEGRFELSIPTLLPQIEGIIADISEHAGRMKFKNLKDYVESIFVRNSRFDRIGKTFYLSTLLEDFEWQDSIPFFSRNAILHGADTNYASASNSLRLILILNQLQDSIQVPLKSKTG